MEIRGGAPNYIIHVNAGTVALLKLLSLICLQKLEATLAPRWVPKTPKYLSKKVSFLEVLRAFCFDPVRLHTPQIYNVWFSTMLVATKFSKSIEFMPFLNHTSCLIGQNRTKYLFEVR